MAAVREGRWDCQRCGSTGLFGRDKICHGCGSPRPEGVKFYMTDDAPVITDQKVVEQAKAGADWICQYCGASNPALADKCQQCEAPKGQARTQGVKEYKGAAPKDGKETPAPAAQALAAAPTSSAPWAKYAIPLGIGAFVLFCCFAMSFVFFNTSQTTGTVESFSWERTIEVEELQTVEETGWDVPSDARVIHEEEAVRSTEQTQVGERTYVCGQRDLGNGFFEDVECTEPIYESEEVYDTQYTYEVEKWVEVETERASGNNQDPYWPEIFLTDEQREGDRAETYTVHLEDESGEDYEVNVSLGRWDDFDVGDELTLEVNGFGAAELVGEK
ncbi:MAG: hypothetical protein H0T73_02815 [Ardenticatenales bacterium]|nr:hypothetical protein [Ardenticatenales bacterium]